ncbi:tetratricopeptide repeat protein, partial [Gammaproteobacteria bacterium]|nr:tetratricopeptide repeat protein [Gammaproteobacteria bacterium]
NKVPSQELLNSLLEHYQNGRYDEAEKLAVTITQQFPQHQFAWKVLGAIFGQSGRTVEAENANQTSVALSPQDPEAHYNSGNTFTELGRLDEALTSYTQAIALKPDLAEAYSKLGNTLKELGRLDEALASYTQAIALKPNYAEAHSNLGNVLQELGRLDEAEASYTQAIVLKPDLALAHSGLGIVLYIKGYEDLALKSIVKANDIEPQSKDYELLLSVMEARKSRKGNEAAVSDTSNITTLTGLVSSPLILNRVVEPELITSLYEMEFIQLDKTKRVSLLASGKTDARYGNGMVSPDFNLFKDARSIIQKLAEDLTKIMIKALKSDIYIVDSFFNILSAGGGTTPHAHLNPLDRIIGLDIGKQKYSLVYYLSVGDQNCREPGILKLYEPGEDILPCEGMITIIPASRRHSAVYGGRTDRVMVGVNFYSL